MEWISIKDRMPDDDREVLLAVRGTEIPIQAYYNHSRSAWYASFEVRDHMRAGRVDDASLFCDNEITHWMELPKMPGLLNPPKEGALNMNTDPNIKPEEEVKAPAETEQEQEPYETTQKSEGE